ncbi:phosphate transporter [Haloterrigena turkmenica DSM 5511]|uniref:Phosphate transporter n=1 Tax=Haloterrigena turkmenica (strain ATCC 51198 / DSM 5511 / JCM 9101 / NCIMB 13204 / VKM B-1734 / 4k) TaxID=543526 RepID=D2RTG0_HALTV|nr:inorganic phosphate transporter [Haloterrigena turkmenica]ADB59003.1 phosphate transporter [Haloterrigena turkmenica DSM 5511]
MVSVLLVVGILVAVFVGYNIGGATTGPAFGPAVGADAISKTMAGVLMTVFFFVGAWTIGRRVVETLGGDLVYDSAVFTLEASVGVLFFIGIALFIGNFFGVPASTSMTAVGSIAGLGLAAGELNWVVMGQIAIWWIVSPFIGFWVSLIIGRYFYSSLNRRVAMVRSEGPLYRIDRSRRVPIPVPTETTNRRELGGVAMVIVIGCLMAFSSGTSNIANAVAPLVGSGELEMNPAILIGCAAVGIGTVTIARRTLETMGNELTELPLTAAIVTATVSASLVIFLSAIGIPASFVIIATMCIIGLGWGRATRPITVSDAVRGEESAPVSVGALTADEEGEELPAIGDEEPERVPSAADLFDPATTARVVLMQNVVPMIATLGAYATFRFIPIFGI